jgi:uncharacterized protein YdaU (DUF1376 family)
MAKDPAFLFYPNDWIGGTLGMTFEEKGAYMELLMTQFNRGHMTTHMIAQVVGQNWDKIKEKFIKDENGLWYNERLEEEKVKRQNFTKSRRNNVSGNNQHKKNSEKNKEKVGGHMDGHMTSHMEDENTLLYNNTINKEKESENLKNSNLFRQPNIPTKDQVWEFFCGLNATKEMAKSFYDKHEGTGWFYNGSPIIKWQSFANNFVTNWNKIEEQKKSKSQFQQPDPTKVKIKLPNSPTPRYD